MNHLLRELAPVPDLAWREIENEAQRSLAHFLTARRLVDFAGPGGWTQDALTRGHVTDMPGSTTEVRVRRRVPLPLIELRVEFDIGRDAVDDLGRGAADVDLDSLKDAARRFAHAEDTIALGDGTFADARGLGAASPHAPIPIGSDSREIPRAVARAIQVLRDAGIDGPYAVALGSNAYTGVVETTEMGGYAVLEHVRLIAGGPVVWSPTVDGALVCSTRGGDARLTIGQDASIGYLGHDATVVRLYLEESLAFEVLSPEAAVRLTDR